LDPSGDAFDTQRRAASASWSGAKSRRLVASLCLVEKLSEDAVGHHGAVLERQWKLHGVVRHGNASSYGGW